MLNEINKFLQEYENNIKTQKEYFNKNELLLNTNKNSLKNILDKYIKDIGDSDYYKNVIDIYDIDIVPDKGWIFKIKIEIKEIINEKKFVYDNLFVPTSYIIGI